MEGNTIKGKILKGIGGFYYIKDAEGNIHECKARGRFRLDRITPLVGDMVEFCGESEEGYGFIEEIFLRKNILIRPAVANIDNLMIVIAVTKPQPDLLLVDKLILHAEKNAINPVICINKMDTIKNPNDADLLKKQYRQYDLLELSATKQTGMDALKKILAGKTSAFTGQSAVGKSSVLNVLLGDLHLKTDGLSKKTSRGKHTTRQSELMEISGINAYVIDTPGFSIFDSVEMDENELSLYYRDFKPYLEGCRFVSCMHLKEPDCAIKAAVERGEIDAGRYQRYTQLVEMLKEKRIKKYD